AHHPETAFALKSRLGNVIGVCAHTVTYNLGDDGGPAFSGKFQFFENQNARAFANDEAIAVFVPRAAGAMRIVVTGGERPHSGKSSDSHRRDCGFRAAGDHHVGIAILDDPGGIADRVGAGGASGAGSLVGPLGVIADADLAGGQVHDRRGDEEGRYLAGAAMEKVGVLAFDNIEPADAGADVHSGALGHVLVFDLVVGH